MQTTHSTMFQTPNTVPQELNKAVQLAKPYSQYLEAHLDTESNAAKLKNVFATTLPRKRVKPSCTRDHSNAKATV